MVKKNNFFLRHKVLFLSLAITFSIIYIILYGPITYVRETWVTSALTTMKHDWLATMLYDEETIAKIKANNYVVEPNEKTDPSLVNVLYQKDKDIEIEVVRGASFTGYLMKVYDPSLLRLVTSTKEDGKGMKVKEFVEEYGAVGGMNSCSFLDEDGHSTGGVPGGIVIVDGKIINDEQKESYHLIGINEDDKLILGVFNKQEILDANIKYALDFAPYLIVNGKPTEIIGNGGGGLAPRTVIGQTEDGTFLLLVIDGRQLATIGADFKDIQKIMLDNGAINAANLDGGSSSLMYYDNKTINCPINSLEGRYLPNAFIVMPTEKMIKEREAEYSNSGSSNSDSNSYSSVSGKSSGSNSEKSSK